MRLGAILDHPKPVLVGDAHHRIHVRWLPVEMHRNDADRSRRNERFESLGIKSEGIAIGVAEDDIATRLGDGLGGGDPRMG